MVLDAKADAVFTHPGNTTLTNLLVTASSPTTSAGATASTTTSAPAGITLNHATFVRTSSPAENPFRVAATSTGSASISLVNSLVSGYSTAGERSASGAGQANLSATYTYLPGMVPGSGPGAAALANLVTTAPTFSASDDFHLAPDSAGIDAGAPGDAAPANDLDGNPRILDGNGDGTAVRDIGAYERPTVVPNPNPTPTPTPSEPSPSPTPSPSPSPSPTPTPTPTPTPARDRKAPQTRIKRGPGKRLAQRVATFTFGASERGVRYQCRLDGARSYRPCKVKATFKKLKRGKHVLRVRAIDGAGNVDGRRPPNALRCRGRRSDSRHAELGGAKRLWVQDMCPR